MKWITSFLTAGIILMTTLVVASPIDTFEFDTPEHKARFLALTKELRCPKCQNQDIADSNSPIAADLRKQVYQQLKLGKSDEQIKQYMVERYGDFVLYRPRVQSNTYLLWYLPIGFAVIGFIVLIVLVRRPKKTVENVELSAEEQQQLNNIIKRK